MSTGVGLSRDAEAAIRHVLQRHDRYVIARMEYENMASTIARFASTLPPSELIELCQALVKLKRKMTSHRTTLEGTIVALNDLLPPNIDTEKRFT